MSATEDGGARRPAFAASIGGRRALAAGTRLVLITMQTPPRSQPELAMRLARPLASALLLALLAAGCREGAASQPLSPAERAAISDTLRKRVADAYDLARPDVVAGLSSLYPDSGRVVSATGGTLTASRDTLLAGIRSFWQNVGTNMRQPTWQWGPMFVDVLSRDAAVLTTTYRVPHLTPDGRPHVIAGAWTAVFARRGGRWVIVQEHLSDAPQPPGT